VPSPAVLATYRRDGSALVSPVWFVRLDPHDARVWNLSAILPAD
jgi:hypothetical protein